MDDPHADIMQGYNNRADPDVLGINFADFIAWLIKPNPGPYMSPHCSTLAQDFERGERTAALPSYAGVQIKDRGVGVQKFMTE